MEQKKFLRVLSLGAGVQSSALALMIEKGEIEMVDYALFSDTMSEPKAVYDWLNYLQKNISYKILRINNGNLKQDVLDFVNKKINRVPFPPIYMKNSKTGKRGIMRRHCTFDYKIKPIQNKVRELLGYKKGQRVSKDTKVEMLMGISFDEMQRMKINSNKYITNIYPLVDKVIRRHDCINWMKKNGYAEPPRSACIFCPYHSNLEWLNIKKNKQEWDDAVAFDEAIRHGFSMKDFDEFYVHRDLVPLKDADLRSAEEKGQYSLLDECEGMCGI